MASWHCDNFYYGPSDILFVLDETGIQCTFCHCTHPNKILILKIFDHTYILIDHWLGSAEWIKWSCFTRKLCLSPVWVSASALLPCHFTGGKMWTLKMGMLRNTFHFIIDIFSNSEVEYHWQHQTLLLSIFLNTCYSMIGRLPQAQQARVGRRDRRRHHRHLHGGAAGAARREGAGAGGAARWAQWASPSLHR